MHAAGFEGSRRRHDDVRVAGGGVSDVAFIQVAASFSSFARYGHGSRL